MKYKKKQAEVEAIQYTGDNIQEIIDFVPKKFIVHTIESNRYYIDSIMTSAYIDKNGYVIKNDKGYYDYKNSQDFKLTYEPIETKTAEQMFIEIGHKKVHEGKNCVIYKQKVPIGINKVIAIDKKLKIVQCQCNDPKKIGYSFGELKAINKQIEELEERGWK